MTGVHTVAGVAALALSAAAAVIGAWCWWRLVSTPWFWRVLRAGQAAVVAQAVLGGLLQLGRHKASGIHLLYEVLPLAVSFVAEQLRVASAQTILDSRGFESAREVGALPPEGQRAIVRAIVQREVGVMALAALVSVVLLVRAAGTG